MLKPISDVHLSYDALGPDDGVPVLLVHALGADGGMWSGQVIPLISAGFKVIRLNLPGHGGSGALPPPYRMEDLSDLIFQFLRELENGPVHYVGLSLGGMCGQGLAIRNPDALRSLITCDALPASLPNADSIWRPRIDAVLQAGTCEAIADATVSRWLSESYRNAHPKTWQRIRDTVAGTNPEGYVGCAQAISCFDFSGDLPNVHVPVLSVCGENDPAVSPSEGRRIASLIPGAQFELIENAMHLPNLEQVERFNQVLLNWLSSQTR